MSTNINLLIRIDEQSQRQRKRIKILNIVAVTLLIGVGLISLGIFILIQTINPAQIKKDQEDVLAKLSQFQGRQANLFVANDRIENIANIFKTRKDFATTLNRVLTKIPGNLSLDDLEVDSNTIIISGQSKSLYTIGEFINNFTDMVRNKDIIKSLTLTSLALDESRNAYQVSIKSEL